MPDTRNHLGELRLLLEELCCDLCRFEHVITDGLAPEAIRIDREYWLGTPGAFADIKVAPAGGAAYFVEVKFGYRNDSLVRHLLRKYASPALTDTTATKIVLVVDRAHRSDWDRLEREIVSGLCQGIELEVWDEVRLVALVAERFGITINRITPTNCWMSAKRSTAPRVITRSADRRWRPTSTIPSRPRCSGILVSGGSSSWGRQDGRPRTTFCRRARITEWLSCLPISARFRATSAIRTTRRSCARA
jgi:hypothetical protein